MTVAAAQAVALRDCLERGERDLARRFFRAASVAVDHAWELSVGADLALPEVRGARGPRACASSTPICAGCARRPSTTPPSPAPSSRWSACSNAHRTCCAPRSPAASRAARGHVAWSERVEGVRRGDAARRRRAHPAARGRPGGRRRGRRLPARQPGLERRLGAAARRRRPPLACRGVGRPGLRPSRVAGRGFAQTRRDHARLRRPRARRARDRARPPRRSRLRRAVGPALGRRRARAVRQRGPARHRSAARAIAGTRSPGCGARRMPASCSWPRRPASASGCCCGAATRAGSRGRSSTACTTTSTARPVAPFSSSTARWTTSARRRAARPGPAPLDRPALVLWGRHDPYLRVDHAERQREAFPRAEIRVLDGAGTGPSSMTRPRRRGAVIGFLARHVGVEDRVAARAASAA